MSQQTRKGLLLLISIVLLAAGGAILHRGLVLTPAKPEDNGKSSGEFIVSRSKGVPGDVKGHFPAQAVERYAFKQNDKDLFNLLIARYQDKEGNQQNAVLFPKDAQSSVIASSPTGLRHEIWQSAADVIARKASENALFLSWWDDGQRIHFLSGKDSWLRKPSGKTFVGPLWKALQPSLLEASHDDSERLAKMARWLTMDTDKALSEIARHFGTSRPVYLLVDNDLLLHLAELSAYGGAPLSINSTTIPVGNDLHGDIAQVSHWASEEGDGNYLAQKEGSYYRVWSTPKENDKNALLVRLLPFVDSLKKLPDGVSLVYQSHWGGFLSIYKIEHKS